MTESVVDFNKLAGVVLFNHQLAPAHSPAASQSFKEAPLHQIHVDIGLRFGQLAVAHPIAEMEHHKRLAGVRRVVAPAFRLWSPVKQ